MKTITLNVMNQISHDRNHSERDVPAYQESITLLFYHHTISLCDNLPGYRFDHLHNPRGYIHTIFHYYKYLLLSSLILHYILTNTGEC